MNIVIIGSGNVAAVFGRKLVAAGHDILQVLSRNASAASELAYEWNTESANYVSLINKNADAYIIAVSDNAIESFVHDLRLPGKVAVHTAAAVPMEILQKVTDNYGVIYPLQSLNKNLKHIPEIPLFTDAANDTAKKTIEKIAMIISGENHHQANLDKRTKLHVAAVVVNNFTNHILALAEDYCKKEGLNFADLIPLLQNTIDRLKEESPRNLQTGPAIRDDNETIAKHAALLKNYPKLLGLYMFLTESIKTK